MLHDELKRLLALEFGLPFTAEQELAAEHLARFLLSPEGGEASPHLGADVLAT